MRIWLFERGTYVQKGASQDTLHGRLDIGIRTHDRAILSTQLHKTRFEVLSAGARDFPAHGRTAGEVDLTDGWVLYHRIDDFGGALGRARNKVEASSRETSVFESARDSPITAGGKFGGFKNGRVTGGEGACRGADSEDVWRIPSLLVKDVPT